MRNRRILVADDDGPVREGFKKLLAAEGAEVFVASDEVRALELFHSQPMDLVILDINLGDDDGWEVFELIRRDDPGVPIVMITAESAQFERGLRAGADVLMEKPIDVPSFLAVINALLEKRHWGDPSADHGCRRGARSGIRLPRSSSILLSPEFEAVLPRWHGGDEETVASGRRAAIGELKGWRAQNS